MAPILYSSSKKSINHLTNQIIQKRDLTLQTLSLPKYDDSSGDLKTIPLKTIFANLKELRSLRSLAIDLSLFPDPHKSINEFLESLKYLKNLSLLHLHFSQSENTSFPQREVSSASQKLRALSKALRKISGLPKLKIKLTFSLVQTRSEEFLMSLKKFSKLESFISVDITLNEYDFLGIKETILSFKKSKSLSQISLTLDECIPHPQDPQTGFHELKTSFKEIKSLKDLRIDLQTDCGITSSNFKELVPIFNPVHVSNPVYWMNLKRKNNPNMGLYTLTFQFFLMF